MNDGPIVVTEHGAYLDLGGRRFGIVDVVPPAGRDEWSGWDSSGWGFTIPMENGAMFDVRWDVWDRLGLSLHLHAPYWGPDPFAVSLGQDDIGPLPCIANRAKGIRVPTWLPRWGAWLDRHLWPECEPEWAAEHIERVAAMPFHDHARLQQSGLARVEFRPVLPRPADVPLTVSPAVRQ